MIGAKQRRVALGAEQTLGHLPGVMKAIAELDAGGLRARLDHGRDRSDRRKAPRLFECDLERAVAAHTDADQPRRLRAGGKARPYCVEQPPGDGALPALLGPVVEIEAEG